MGGTPLPPPLRDPPRHPRDLFGGDYIKRKSSRVPLLSQTIWLSSSVLWCCSVIFDNGGPPNESDWCGLEGSSESGQCVWAGQHGPEPSRRGNVVGGSPYSGHIREDLRPEVFAPLQANPCGSWAGGRLH